MRKAGYATTVLTALGFLVTLGCDTTEDTTTLDLDDPPTVRNPAPGSEPVTPPDPMPETQPQMQPGGGTTMPPPGGLEGGSTQGGESGIEVQPGQ